MLAHILAFNALGMFGTYNFTTPVNPAQAIMIDLSNPGKVIAHPGNPVNNASLDASPDKGKSAVEENPGKTTEKDKNPSQTAPEQPEPEPTQDVPITDTRSDSSDRGTEPAGDQHPAASPQLAPAPAILPPLRATSEFLTTKTENLSYLISILGMPVGSAELGARNVKGEVCITLGVRSNAALASIYPVNDVIETRHIAGNFVITNIRQQEGDFKSDIGFTIFMRDKSVFWFDRLRKRYSRETVPTSEVLDTLSAFYLLRNRVLQVGRTETLNIYDGDNYSPVLVEVLRQETIRLPNLRKIDTLVVHPIRKNGGTFRKAGDMLIWLTNDENKVPVKMETSLPLGKVTAELISAESEQ